MKNTITRTVLFLFAGMLISCNKTEKTKPVRKNLEDAVFASGYVEKDEEYLISAKISGNILDILVTEGDQISKNSLVATIENKIQTEQLKDAETVYSQSRKNTSSSSAQLLQIQSQIDQAQHQAEQDKVNFQRYQELRVKNSVSQLDLEKAQLQYRASQNNLISLQKNYQDTKSTLELVEKRNAIQVDQQNEILKDYNITSPGKGEVLTVFKKKGELVKQGDNIVKIGNGHFKLRLYVSEDDIAKIRIGQKAAIRLNTYPNDTFSATIVKILPAFDETEQSYIVEAKFEKLPKAVFSGTQLQADIETTKRKNVLVIPTSYITKGNYVTLENKVQKQIVTGSKDNEWTEIRSGISEKDVLLKPKN
ncbi:efflux RND transporter periplasmic adaptor subunit [Epilithonimonas mollis]|uniref:HlyD family secretion protein n=1 Tax=Epilithonimonas mollis TaxID=216903 RepID=A0A1M6MXL7_9FLAO|nr:HlyD family efflux transporter periplasmic adaptor subunit [Epilithonimonas mollis]SHJ88053.1 HlyD family secretion protein [Epilithonimonas mollis]